MPQVKHNQIDKIDCFYDAVELLCNEVPNNILRSHNTTFDTIDEVNMETDEIKEFKIITHDLDYGMMKVFLIPYHEYIRGVKTEFENKS